MRMRYGRNIEPIGGMSTKSEERYEVCPTHGERNLENTKPYEKGTNSVLVQEKLEVTS